MKSGTGIPIPTEPAQVAVGAELGSYRLTSLLGQGAMGRVFKAKHLKLGREVAVKVLNPEYAARPDVLQRFFREARVVNQIGHEHVVDVTDLVELPGCAFLVMELLEGESLGQVAKRRKRRWPTVRSTVEVMAQVCDALDAAHRHGVVHRDLKPDNIFIVKRGGRDFAKVLDFGVAKLREPGTDSTSTGVVVGTPRYMAPEQAAGEEVGPAADIWAAGVVLYQLLSGDVPFHAEGFVALASKLQTEPAPPLPPRTPRRERIPPPLAATVMRCLEKKPADRFRSMASLAEALRGSAKDLGRGSAGRRLAALAAAILLAGAAALAAVRTDVPRAVRSLAAEVMRRVAPAPPGPGARPAQAVTVPRAAPSPPAASPGTSSGPSTTTAKSVARQAAQRRKPERVELDLSSKPSGATVVRLDTGEKLGTTPLRVKVRRGSGELALRFTLDGYQPATASVDLKSGGSVNVAMRPRKATAKKKRSAAHPR
jgi:serine/threonine-protein kinase